MTKILAIIFVLGVVFGGVKLWEFFQTHEAVCVDYQVIQKIEPFQKLVSISDSNRYSRTESQTWYYIYLKNGSVQSVHYLDEKTHIGNEICAKQEWKSKNI